MYPEATHIFMNEKESSRLLCFRLYEPTQKQCRQNNNVKFTTEVPPESERCITTLISLRGNRISVQQEY